MGLDDTQATVVKMQATEALVAKFLSGYSWEVWDGTGIDILAVIEQIDPRPTYFQGKRSILRSTCIIYGEYRMCRATLATLGIPFLAVTPKNWQAHYGLAKEKLEGDTSWKNRLKARAQSLFPDVKVTLATADALLLAEYGRQCLEKHHAPERYKMIYSPGRDPIL